MKEIRKTGPTQTNAVKHPKSYLNSTNHIFCQGHLSWLLASPEFILFNLHLLWKAVLGGVWGKRGLCLKEPGPSPWELNPALAALSVCNQVTETACVDCVFVLALFSAFLRKNN